MIQQPDPHPPPTLVIDPDACYLPAQLAAYLQVSEATLQDWRYRGGGPEFLKLKNGRIRYEGSAVLAWKAARRRRTTSDPGSGAGAGTPAALTEVRQDVRGVMHVRTIRRGAAVSDETLQPLDDAPVQACGHPWSAVVWLDDETCDCGACLTEETRGRLAQEEEDPP